MQPFLDGIRVLDLTRLLPGSYATTALADFGADVVKVEEPETGDPIRHRPPSVDGRSYAHLCRNRTKQSVGIDLKHEDGKEAFLHLAESADVLVESFRPGVMERLDLGYERLRERNDAIVYCSLSGYGQTGPYADAPGHDLNYVALSGLLGLTGEATERPHIPGYPIADLAGGLYAAFAITTALAGRTGGDPGEYLDVSMTDVVASFAVTYVDRFFGREEPQERGETILTGGHPAYGVFECRDGLSVTVSALEKQFWDGFCEAIDRPELQSAHEAVSEDINGEAARQCRRAFEAEIATRQRSEWMEQFREHDVPAAPVRRYEEVFEESQLRRRGLFDRLEIEGDGRAGSPQGVVQVLQPVTMVGDRLVEPAAPSKLGEDTAELLGDAGYGDERIAALERDGAITLGREF